ncbi:MAG TPA: rhomboid family intramembrane serine protease [Candidatus Bipolaricaulota bacterium]
MIPLRDYRPSGIVPYVSYGLLALNVLVFLYQLLLEGRASDVYGGVLRLANGEQILVFSDQLRRGFGLLSQNEVFVNTYGMVPCKLFGGCPAYSFAGSLVQTVLQTSSAAWQTLFTSMFMHGSLFHLGSNMLYLWIFADNVEASFGHWKFLGFYLLCGLAAAFAQALMDTHSPIPMIGASGAISGVLGAYLFMFPHARVLTLVPIIFFIQFIRLPALIVLGIWFAGQVLSALLSSGAGGGVAVMAHIGGFVAGAVLYRFLRRAQPVASQPFPDL